MALPRRDRIDRGVFRRVGHIQGLHRAAHSYPGFMATFEWRWGSVPCGGVSSTIPSECARPFVLPDVTKRRRARAWRTRRTWRRRSSSRRRAVPDVKGRMCSSRQPHSWPQTILPGHEHVVRHVRAVGPAMCSFLRRVSRRIGLRKFLRPGDSQEQLGQHCLYVLLPPEPRRPPIGPRFLDMAQKSSAMIVNSATTPNVTDRAMVTVCELPAPPSFALERGSVAT